MAEGGISLEELSIGNLTSKKPDLKLPSIKDSSLSTHIGNPSEGYHIPEKGLASFFRNEENRQISTPHTREPIIFSPDNDEDQKRFTNYSNFDEQFSQAKSLLEQNPEESACLFLVHQEPDPRDPSSMINIVTFHQIRKNDNGELTIQQVPAVHKLLLSGVNVGDIDHAQNQAIFSTILTEGFIGATTPKTADKPNTIIYPEGEREYFASGHSPEITTEEEFFVELWGSYPFHNSETGNLYQDQPPPQLFSNEEMRNNTIYSRIGYTPPSEINGVIVFPENATPEQIEKKKLEYQKKYPNWEFTFLRRNEKATLPIQ